MLRREAAEQAILFVVRTRGEIKRTGNTAVSAISDAQRPESWDDDRLTVWTPQLFHERPLWCERVDVPVSKVSDEDVARNRAERRGSDCKTPRRIELAVLGKSNPGLSRQIERVHDPMPLAGHIVMFVGILHSIGH